jgi:hypothetical protein
MRPEGQASLVLGFLKKSNEYERGYKTTDFGGLEYHY